MQKILFTARSARGATEAEVAAVLAIEVPAYQALEKQLTFISPAIAEVLAAYFSVPAFYFLSRPPDIRARIECLEQKIALFEAPSYHALPANAPMALATATLALMIARQELMQALTDQMEMAQDLSAALTMNAYLEELLHKKTFKNK